MTKRFSISLAILLTTIFLSSPPLPAGESEQLAVSAAVSWLALVDSGNYGTSWVQAAELFKGAVSKPQWEQALNGARRPLGRLVSRKVASAKYTTQLPGAPDGEYVVIQFATRFENKSLATETVTPMKGSDGKWRVSGYYIK